MYLCIMLMWLWWKVENEIIEIIFWFFRLVAAGLEKSESEAICE